MTARAAQAETEVWLNTAVGSRWYRALDLYGRETSKVVKGGRTFTITTFERQLNQENVASPELDLFRNGTFVIKKESEATNPEEVRSPNSLTDGEIADIVQELVHGQRSTDEVLETIQSTVTLNRIYEALVLEDAPSSLIADVKARAGVSTPTRAPVPQADPVMTQPEEPDDGPAAPAEEEPSDEGDDADVDEFDQVEGDPVEANVADDAGGSDGGST